MKKIFTALLLLVGFAAFSQSIGRFRYDSTILEKVGGNNELIILNSTRNITGGVLTNLGNGRTGFVLPGSGPGNGIGAVYSGYGLFKINDSTLRADTNFTSGLATAWRLQKTRDSLLALIAGKQATGNYITALTGDVTATGPGSAAATLSNTGVTAGSYSVPNITVDAKGRVTNISTGPTIPAQFNPIAGTNMSLSGTYPNITFNASGGGGGGSLSNLGAKFEIGVTGTSNLKTIQEGYNIKGDSTGSILTISSRDTIYMLVSGQSNSVGHQFAGEIYHDTTSSAYVQGWNVTSDSWVRLRQAHAPMGSIAPGVQYTAPDDSSMASFFYLAQELHKKTGKVIRVFQLGYGATAIDNWLPEGSTIFARIKTELAAAGNPKIDYMIWHQGESDASMDDTAYKRRVDSLQAQLDRQSWFGPDIPMFMVACTNTGVNFKILEIQRMLYSGRYDKRWKFIDGINLPVTSDNIHYTSYAQYQLALKMFGYIYNDINMPYDYVNIDQTRLERVKLNAPRLLPGYVFNDSAGNRKYFLQAPFIQAGDNSLAATLASTRAQISQLDVRTYHDSTFNKATYSLQYRLGTDTLAAIDFVRGSSGSSRGAIRIQTGFAVLNKVAEFGEDGKLSLFTNGIDVPNLTSKYSGRFGGMYFQSNAATNNNFITSNIIYNGGFQFVNAGAGVVDYFDAAGPRVWQFAPSGSAGATPTLTSVFMVKPDGSFGIGGTGMGTSLSSVTSAALQGTSGGNIGIGTTPSVKFHVLSTSEQFRSGYDASNYLRFTTASTGSTTLDLVGTTPVLTISDSLTLTGVTQTAIDTTQWGVAVIHKTNKNVKWMNWAYAGSGGGGGSGTVTNVATGLGLTGGPITTTGTVSVDTTVGVGVIMWPRMAKLRDSLAALIGGGSAITIGTTAISSGTVGRVLFQGTGNVVQQTSNLFWDNTNGWLGLRTSTPQNTIDIAAGSLTLRDFLGHTSGAALDMGYYTPGSYGAIRAYNPTTTSYSDLYLNDKFRITAAGKLGVNGVTAPTAWLQIGGGSATANTAPLKINSGTLLGTTEAGAIENDGTHLYYTAANAGTRYQLDQQSGSGTVTSFTATDGNGFDFSVANSTTTPTLTATTTVGDGQIMLSNSGAISGSSVFLFTGNTFTMFAGSSLKLPQAALSSNTTLDNTYYTVLVDATGGNRTITLPTATGNANRIYVVKKIDASANTVTIDGNGFNIDGAATKVISTQWAGATVHCNGGGWYVTGVF